MVGGCPRLVPTSSLSFGHPRLVIVVVCRDRGARASSSSLAMAGPGPACSLPHSLLLFRVRSGWDLPSLSLLSFFVVVRPCLVVVGASLPCRHRLRWWGAAPAPSPPRRHRS